MRIDLDLLRNGFAVLFRPRCVAGRALGEEYFKSRSMIQFSPDSKYLIRLFDNPLDCGKFKSVPFAVLGGKRFESISEWLYPFSTI
jgi:hypothetical protein